MMELIQNWTEILLPLGFFSLIILSGYALWRIGWKVFDEWSAKIPWTESLAIVSTVKAMSFFWIVIAAIALALEVSVLPVARILIAEKALWTILLLSIAWVLIRLTDRLIRIYSERLKIPSHFLIITRRTALILIIVIIVLTVLSIWGLPTNALLLGVAVLILLTFLILRDMLSDIIAGFDINASGRVKKND